MGCNQSKPVEIEDDGTKIMIETSSISDDKVIKLLNQKVKEIYLICCYSITDKTIAAIARKCHSLERIWISYCYELTEDSLKAIKECKMLQNLGAVSCPNLLTEDGVKCFVSGCESLKELHFSECGKLSDNAVQLIVKSFPKLEQLTLESCGLTSLPEDIGNQLKCLKHLDIRYSEISDETVQLIVKSFPKLEQLTLYNCGLTSLPEDIGNQLKCLKYLNILQNNLTKLPSSIANLADTCEEFDVNGNPLQEPPYEIAKQGLQAVKRYFDELHHGSTICKQLKVVLLGDGGAGKTSIRNAIAGRTPALHDEKDRTIYLDMEPYKLPVDKEAGLPEDIDEITLMIYDCGGQQDYATGQSPFISKGAFFVLVVPADIDMTNNKDYEEKVLRFLVLLQNKAPGAQVQLVLSKVDKIPESEREEIMKWLHKKVTETVDWWHESSMKQSALEDHTTLRQGAVDRTGLTQERNASIEKLHILPNILDFSVKNYDKARAPKRSFWRNLLGGEDPMPQDAKEATFSEDAQIEPRLRAVIIELVQEKKLPTVGQRIPKSWLTHWRLLYQVSKMGINVDKQVLFEKAISEDTSPFSSVETSDDKGTKGAYCDVETLKDLWDGFCASKSVFKLDTTFDDALELLAAQGSVFKDYGLVFLHPSFVTTLLKPLIDHRLTEKRVEEPDFLKEVEQFASGQEEKDKLIFALKKLAQNGELGGIVLHFLWGREIKELEPVHYDKVLNMLIASGFIFASSRPEGTVPIVLFKLPPKPSGALKNDWPSRIPTGQQQVELHVELWYGCPPGLAARFAARTHGLGYCVHTWLYGAIVSASNDRIFRCERGVGGPVTQLVMLVRETMPGEKETFGAETLSTLQSAYEFLCMEQKNRLPGLYFKAWVACPRCLSQRQPEPHRFDLIELDNLIKSKSKEGPRCDLCGKHIEIDFESRFSGQSADTFAKDISNLELLAIIRRDIHGVNRRLDRIDSHLDGIGSQLSTIKTAILDIVNNKDQYPGLFYILPFKPEKDCRNFLKAADNLFNEKYMAVFLCGKTKKPVKYGKEFGLVFTVPKKPVADFLGTVNDFWARYGPIIKVSTTLVRVAVKAYAGADINALFPADFGEILKSAEEKFKFLEEAATRAGEIADAASCLVGAERSTWDSIKPASVSLPEGLNPEDTKLVEAVGKSYIEFGRFLDAIGFDRSKLDMEVAMVKDENGTSSMQWVSRDSLSQVSINPVP